MVMEVKPLHPKNASSPMEVTEMGRVIEVKLQCLKAPSPIEVTELGMVMEVKLSQS
jgi:hypothetical protein